MTAGLSLGEIAGVVQGRLSGEPDLLIKGVNSLEAAGEGELSFYADHRYKNHLEKTRASALLVGESLKNFKGPQIIVPNPSLAYARVAALLAPPVPRFEGVSSQAFISDDCAIGKDVSIFPFAYVGRGSVIGEGSVLYPGVFIGDGVRIGRNTILYPGVTVLRGCIIGDNVIINAGTVIGSDGFGFVKEGAVSVKVPQLGIVQIDDDVEIGANNCIDRAAIGKTWIKRGVKTDNLVQIAHNVVIGEDSIIVALTGISGSVKIGNRVLIAGQVGVGDHLEIGDGAMIGPKAGIVKSISAGEMVLGVPAMPYRNFMRCSGLFGRLPELVERIRRLEKALLDGTSKNSGEVKEE